MSDSEIAEIERKTNEAVSAAIQIASQLAQVAIEARIAQLRRAAEQSRRQARRIEVESQVRHAADAALWQATRRPGYWREAGALDVARSWQAAKAWEHVDPRAQAALREMAQKLAERGVRADPRPGPPPQHVADLSEPLDSAAVERAAAELDDVDRDPQAEVRRDEMAEQVRAVWPSQRAERVVGCAAWPVLADQLVVLQQAGHDPATLLAGVSDFVDRARTPAAFAVSRVRLAAGLDAEVAPVTEHGQAAAAPTVDGQWSPTPADPESLDRWGVTHQDVERAAGLVTDSQFASVSMLQRRQRIGFGKAGAIMDELERIGVVGPDEPGRSRDVRVSAAELPQRLRAAYPDHYEVKVPSGGYRKAADGGQKRPDGARGEPRAVGGDAQAASAEAQGAAIVATAYPHSTADAVAAAAQQAKNGQSGSQLPAARPAVVGAPREPRGR